MVEESSGMQDERITSMRMRTYLFAPIAAREYPTIALLDNPYVWGGVQMKTHKSWYDG